MKQNVRKRTGALHAAPCGMSLCRSFRPAAQKLFALRFFFFAYYFTFGRCPI